MEINNEKHYCTSSLCAPSLTSYKVVDMQSRLNTNTVYARQGVDHLAIIITLPAHYKETKIFT